MRPGQNPARGELPSQAMARLLRSSLPDGTFHVTSHGLEDWPIFRCDLDRLDFLYLLGIVAHEHQWRVHAYCLMTTHYHAVVESTTAQLSAGMQRLNGRYAQLFNGRHRRRGHVFEARFSSWVVRDEPHYTATVEYVRQNPVRAGICESAREWPWSKVDVVSEEGSEPFPRAKSSDVGRQAAGVVRDVPAEKEPIPLVPDDQRDMARRVPRRRNDEQRAVAGDVERPGERSDGRPGEVDEHGLGKRPPPRDVPPQPP
jgi:REP element-mobilizing transposase RayT